MTQTATASTCAIKVQEGKCWRQGQVSNQHQLAREAKRATSSSLEDRPDKARVWIVGGREEMLEGGWDRRRCTLWDHVTNAWSCGDDVAYRESLQCAGTVRSEGVCSVAIKLAARSAASAPRQGIAAETGCGR